MRLPKTELFASAMLAASLAAVAPSNAQSVRTHHVRESAHSNLLEATPAAAPRVVGALAPDRILSLDLVLPLGDEAALDSFLAQVYDPQSPEFRHFLTPSEFTARFGPSQEDYSALVRFAQTNGFQVTGGSRDGMEVQVRGPVNAVERAFHLSMKTFQHPTENRTYFGPDREPTVDLPSGLWHISGLDNFSIPHPLVVNKSVYAAAHGVTLESLSTNATTGSGPSASFLGSDMRAAYATGTTLTGAGQHLGLLEYVGTDLADLNTYYKNTGQTNKVPITLLSTDGTSTACTHNAAGGNCDDTEQNLDITQALGMAPGLASLTLYVGSSDTAMISAMTTHSPLPTTIGCSWGWTPADPATLDPFFKKMAAQGQNFFAASGDASTWSRSNEAWPADDAYVVSVGGTDLVTAGAGGAWKAETAWVDSGGGISPDSIAIPSWQKTAGVINSSNKGSTTLRNGPDVAANANFSFYTCSNQTTCLANSYGGTSFAAPMWAGYVALVNQQLAAAGKAPIGFINPTLYAANVTGSYSTNFHDIVSGTSGSYSAVKGFDLVTGWGSPKPALINTLAGSASQTPAFTLSAASASPSVQPGGSATSTITTAVNGGFNSAISLSASGAPAGVKVSFTPASIAAPGSGTSTANISVASTTAPGTYTITVTATGGGITHTALITLTVTAQPGIVISSSTSALTVKRGTSGSATITVSAVGGFKGSVALNVSGEGTGDVPTLSPHYFNYPGTGTSTLTIAASSTAVIQTSTLTISATAGGKTVATTIAVTISRY